MRTHRLAPARVLLGLTAIIVGASCADKAFRPVNAVINPHMALRIMTSTAQQVAPTPRYVLVAAGGIAGGDTGLLAVASAKVTGTTQTITLNVDISPCLAANAAKGAGGCSIIVAAVLSADSFVVTDTGNFDPFSRAFDYTIVGPFDVSSGHAPTIPPIDLSASRFSIYDWAGDYSLRMGNAQHVVATGGTPLGRVLTGVVTSGVADPVLYSVTSGTDWSNWNQSSGQPPPQPYPALAIFESGNWRRVLATTAPPLNTGNTSGSQGFMDVTALATNDVYAAATSGLYKFDGTSFAKISAVTDSLYSVASAPLAGGGRIVIAGGPNGVVWIGYGTSWQRYVTASASRFDGVCITGPNEAFASSNVTGALYRFNGSAWTAVPPPVTGPKMDLQCPGPGVAFVTVAGVSHYRWNGSSWTALPGSGGAPGRSPRIGVASASEIYAAGDSASVDRAFYKFDGSSWTEIGRRRFAQSPLKVWADPRGGAAYVLSGFGSLEKVTPSKVSLLSYQPALRDIMMTSATSAFAVGWNLFMARWDGGKWTVDPPPSGTVSTRILQGVWSDGPSNAWAVGNSSTIMRYNGSSWSLLSDANKPIATPDSYNAVWGAGSDVWIAGENSIVHCKSTTSCAVENSSGGTLYSVWGSSASNIFAVGANGRILRFNGTSWTTMNSPTTRNLARVAGSGPTDAWAVGDSVLLRFDGTQWKESPFTDQLRWARSRVPSTNLQNTFQVGLWVRSPKEAYLGGENGAIIRWDGTDWRATGDGATSGRRVMGITGAAGCALAAMEGQTDAPLGQTLWRGIGTNGCFSTGMGLPSNWP